MKTDELKIRSDSYSEKAGKLGVCGGKDLSSKWAISLGWESEGVPVTDGENGNRECDELICASWG